MRNQTSQTTKKGVKTQTKILRRAARLFAKSGFKGVTIDQIAKSAGLTKGALYSHFKSKHEIYLQSLQWYFAPRLQKDWNTLQGENDLEKFSDYLSWLIGLLQKDEIFRLLLIRLIIESDKEAIRFVLPSVFTRPYTVLMEYIEKTAPSREPMEYAFSIFSIAILNRNLEEFWEVLAPDPMKMDVTTRIPLKTHILDLLGVDSDG